MTYDPREYWPRRSLVQGPSYVGPGGNPTRSSTEARAFSEAIATLTKGRHYGRLLDFGCGSGRMTPTLAGLCDEYVGCDINVHALSLWRSTETIVHLHDDRIPFPDDHFDAVACTVVLQHIVGDGDFRGWTAEIARVLMPGGHAIVIDNVAVERPAAHMRPRGAGAVARALGATVLAVIDLPAHWAALMVVP